MSSASDYLTVPSPDGAKYAAVAGNMAQQLYQMIGGLGDDYFKGTQNARTLQMQKPILGPDGKPTTDVNSILTELLKRGGGEAAQSLLPSLIQRQLGASNAGAIEDASRGVNTSPIGQSPDMLHRAGEGQGQGGQPGGTPPLSATGTDNSGADTLNSLAAEHRVDLDAFLQKFPGARNLLNRDLTPGQVQGIKQRMAQFGGGSGRPTDGMTSPDANETTPVGTGGPPSQVGQGSGQISPAQDNFGNRFDAANGGQPQPPITMAEIQRREAAAQHLYAKAAATGHFDPQGAAALEKAAEGHLAIAKQGREQLGKYGEPTREQKNARDSGVLGFERAKGIQSNDIERGGKQYDNIQHQADEAHNLTQTLKLTKSLMDDQKFYSGVGEEYNLMWKRIKAAAGIAPDEAVPQEVFRKTVSAAIMDQIRGLGGQGLGQVRVAEINVMKQAAQNHDNSPASNRLLTELQLRQADRWTLPIADLARNYKADHGTLDAGFDRVKADYINKHPLLSKDELDDPRRIAPPLVRTPADLKRIGWHDGTPFRTPDGRIFTHAPEGFH
jgi:hypothetical protein